MFYDKTKATWKAAFKILKSPSWRFEKIIKLSNQIKTARKTIEFFEQEESIRKLAYIIAEDNGFKGEPDFYWSEAKEQLRIRVIGMGLAIQLLEMELITLRQMERQMRN